MAKEPLCYCEHSMTAHMLTPSGHCSSCPCKLFTDKRISVRRAASKSTREAGPKSDIIKLLEARGIRTFRLNSFDAVYRNNGKKYRIMGNKKGTPDLQAIIHWDIDNDHTGTMIFWIEVKKSDGKPSKEQVEFQAKAEALGETYLLARSAEEVEKWLKENL